jgi:hypothetical protein
VIEHEQEVEGLTRNITLKLQTFKKKEKTDTASDDVTKTVTHHATPKEYADIFIAPHPLITSSKAIIDSAALIMPQICLMQRKNSKEPCVGLQTTRQQV